MEVSKKELASRLNNARKRSQHFTKPRSKRIAIQNMKDVKAGIKNKTGFVDLPPEIRNRIYFLVLTTENPIRLARRKVYHVFVTGKRRAIYHKVEAITLSNGGNNRRRKVKLPLGKVLTLSILLTTQAIKTEAISILYGANTFAFRNVAAIMAFGLRFPSNFRLIREVKILDDPSNGMTNWMSFLTPLEDPNRIEIPIAHFQPWSEKWAKDLWSNISLFVMVRQEPRFNDTTKAKFYETVAIGDGKEALKRFNMLVFVIRKDLVYLRGDGTEIVTISPAEAHIMIQNLLIERWTADMEEELEEAKKDVAEAEERVAEAKERLAEAEEACGSGGRLD